MRIKIKVIPNSKKEEIIRQIDGSLVVKIKEKPEKGKATLHALKVLSKYFNKEVKLVRGAFNREKIIEVEE